MTENPLTYIFSLQDQVSDKMLPITVASEKMLNIFADLQTKTMAVSSLFEETGGSLGALKEKVALLKEEKEWISPDNKEAIGAYNQEIAALNRQISNLSNINGKGFEETGVSIGSLRERIKQLKSEREWIPADNKEALSTCNQEIEGLTKQLQKLSSYNGAGIEKAANSIGGLQEKVQKLKQERDWIPADNTQKIIECNKEIEKTTKQIEKLSTIKATGFQEFIGNVVNSIPALKMFSSPAALVSAGVSKLTDTIQKGEAAWGNYKKIAESFHADMQGNIGATNAEVKSILSLIDAQQQLGIVGKQVQMSGVQELSTHVTRHESIQELLPTLNDAIAQQHGVNASQQQATEIASAFGAALNGQTEVLSQYGYQFTEAQNRILMYGDETARVSTLTEIVGNAVNGVNEALGQTPEGGWQQYEEKMNNVYTTIGKLKEQFTQTLFPIFKTVGEILEEVVGKIEEKMDSISIVLGTIATGVSEVFQFLSPILMEVIDFLGFFFDKLAEGNPLVIGITSAISAYAIITELLTLKTTLLNVVQGICNTLFSISPLGWVAIAIGAVVTAVSICWNKFEGFRKAIMGAWEVVKAFGSALVEAIVNPIKQIIKGVGSVVSAIGSMKKGNFSEAKEQLKGGFKDIGAGMIKGNPLIGTPMMLASKLHNTDFTGAYEKGAQKGAESWAASQEKKNKGNINEQEEIEETEEADTGKKGNGSPTNKAVTIPGSPIKAAITPTETVSATAVNLPDKSMLPDINPTAEYKEIAASLTPKKVDLAPAKTATETKDILQSQKEKNTVVTSVNENTHTNDTSEGEFIVNDKEQLYQPEKKEDVLQAILENVQKLVDMFKEVGNIKNIFNTSLKLNDVTLQEVNTENSTNESEEKSGVLKNVYSNIVITSSSLASITRSTSDIVANTDTLISLFASYVSESRGNSSIATGESSENIPEGSQPEQIFSISDIIGNMKNSFLAQIESARNSLTELYNAFTSFTQNDLGSEISNGIQNFIDKLIGDISGKLQPETLIEKIKETFDKVNTFMDIDLSEVGTNIVNSFVAQLEGLFNEITGSEFITNLTQGFEKIRDKITNNIPDNLNLDSITEGIREAFDQLNNLMNVDLSTVGTEIANSFMNKMEGIFNDLMNSDVAIDLSTLIETIKNKITGIIPDKQDFETIFQEIKKGLSQINTLIDVDLSAVGTEIAEKFTGKIETIFDGLANSDLAKSFTTAFEKVTEKFNQITNIDLSTIGTEIGDTFVKQIEDIFTSITESDLATTISSKIEGIKNNISNVIPENLKLNTIFDGVKDFADKVNSFLSFDIDLSGIEGQLTTSFNNLKEKLKKLTESDLVVNVTNGLTEIKEQVSENIPEEVKSGTLLKEIATQIVSTGPLEVFQQPIKTAFGIIEDVLGLSDSQETDTAAEASSLPAETIGTDTTPEKSEKKKPQKGGLLKRAFTQAGVMAIAGIAGGIINAGAAADKIDSITGEDNLPGTLTTEDELGLATAISSTEEAIEPASTSAITLLPLPTPADEGLSSMPSFIMTDNRLLTPETLTAPTLADTVSPESELEEIEEPSSMLDNLFDNVRQAAAITAIPLMMTTLSPDNNLQSTAMIDENISNSSSIFDQSDEAEEKEGRSISIDQVCEQIVIHVENTDREGTEHIKEEIYRVLREIVEA